jgi:hypothetical protein
MFSDFNSILASVLFTDLLITALLFVWAEHYQRKQLARRGKRMSVWWMVAFAVFLAPFVLLQIGVAGCLVVMQLAISSSGHGLLLDRLFNWLPFILWGFLAAGIVWGLLSLRRAAR